MVLFAYPSVNCIFNFCFRLKLAITVTKAFPNSYNECLHRAVVWCVVCGFVTMIPTSSMAVQILRTIQTKAIRVLRGTIEFGP